MPSKKQKQIKKTLLLAGLFAFIALFAFSLVALKMLDRQSLDNRSDAAGFEMASGDAPLVNCGTQSGDAQRACERAALMALYNSTGGPNWTNKQGWNTSADYCSWFGVSCLNNLVSRLEFSNNNLSGIIPPDLGNLNNLQIINLDFNNLTGLIPSELRNLQELIGLSIISNHLSGSIPSAIGQLNKLRSLSLGFNSFSGQIPPELSSLSNLEYLSLSANNLTGAIPPQFGELKKLKVLRLSIDTLSGSLPTSLGSLSQLEYLDLRNTNIQGPIPATYINLSSLQTFLFQKQPAIPNPICVANPTVRNFLTTVENIDPNQDNVQPGPSVQEGLPDCANSFTTKSR